jgi:dihydrofolate synthase/folylpolyglutamate synthase
LSDTGARLVAKDGRPLVIIVGMLGRKDARGFFEAFTSLRPRVFTTGFGSPSATPATELTAAAESVGLQATSAEGVTNALSMALEGAGPPPHVLICGSLHFIGDVLAMSPATWPA